MRYKAIIFDLDGTLLDTIEDIADSMNYVLSKYNFPLHSIEEYKYFVGDGMDKLVYRALPIEVKENKFIFENALSLMKEVYSKNFAVKTSLYNNIPELLDKLNKSKISLSILSNKPQYFTEECVKKFLNKWYFYPVLGVSENTPKKPDIKGAINISTQLNVPVNSILFVGDTSVDIETANKANMVSVGVLWGFRKEKELKESGAQFIIKDPLELLHLIEM